MINEARWQAAWSWRIGWWEYLRHHKVLAKEKIYSLVHSAQRQPITADTFALSPDLMPMSLQRKSYCRSRSHTSSAHHSQHDPTNPPDQTHPNIMHTNLPRPTRRSSTTIPHRIISI